MKARDFRKNAFSDLSGKWLPAVGTTFIASLLGAGVMMGQTSGFRAQITNKITEDNEIINQISDPEAVRKLLMIAAPFLIGGAMLAIIISLIRFIVGAFVSLGLIQYNLDLVDGKSPRFNVIFGKSDMIGQAFVLRLLVTIYTVLWTLLFVIPGIIKSYSYSMSGFIMAENPDMTANEAISVSRDMMNGNKWRLFCLRLSFIGWAILCAFTLGIGLLWLKPYENAAIAEFYNEISRGYQKRN